MVGEISVIIREELLNMADLGYKKFHSKLVPTLSEDVFIGVRTPILRDFAKDMAKRDDIGEFLSDLPHIFYEENNLHGMILEQIMDFDEVVSGLNEFLPYVDNWATCDLISPKNFAKEPARLYEQILIWLKSDHVYTKRFAMSMLMKHFLDGNFKAEILDIVTAIQSDEYYVNMMIAWFMATAMAKQPEATLGYFECQTMDNWTHNKAIQKCVESSRISADMKKYLRGLKVK